jgi:hypothetical protein
MLVAGVDSEKQPTQTEKYRENLRGREPKSRGIPGKDQLFLPDYRKVRELLKIEGNPFDEYGVSWEAKDVLQFIFPRTYRETYHAVASSFLDLLLLHPEGLHSEQIANWIRGNGVSKATFYNKVLPRLKHLGLVDAERKNPQNEKSGYILKPSEVFHNYLFKLAKEWLRIVRTSRARQKQQQF